MANLHLCPSVFLQDTSQLNTFSDKYQKGTIAGCICSFMAISVQYEWKIGKKIPSHNNNGKCMVLCDIYLY